MPRECYKGAKKGERQASRRCHKRQQRHCGHRWPGDSYQAGVQQCVGASSNSAAFILAMAFSPPSNISEIIPLYSAVSRISGFIDPAGDPDDAPCQDLIGDWPYLTQARCFMRPLRSWVSRRGDD